MKYAIMESGGKQYKAVPGETVRVDRLPNEVNDKIDLDKVLLVVDDGDIKIGTPILEGATIKATVSDQIKGRKIRVFKYKPKVRYRKRQGHRQRYTLLKIDEIVTD
ncbi:MAG: 50S ribosomal protein L21 [Anaerolineales bacterium]|nr:50S ribosomal protein L21 [Anaerolineales bacterium]